MINKPLSAYHCDITVRAGRRVRAHLLVVARLHCERTRSRLVFSWEQTYIGQLIRS